MRESESRDRDLLAPGAKKPLKSVASYVSVRPVSSRYHYRQESYSSAQGGASDAKARARKCMGFGPGRANWRVRGGAPFALPREDWDNSRRERYVEEPDCTLT